MIFIEGWWSFVDSISAVDIEGGPEPSPSYIPLHPQNLHSVCIKQAIPQSKMNNDDSSNGGSQSPESDTEQQWLDDLTESFANVLSGEPENDDQEVTAGTRTSLYIRQASYIG